MTRRLAAPSLALAALAALATVAITATTTPGIAHADATAKNGPRGSLGVGTIVALTGPISLGWAAEAEFFPGRALGRFGMGTYYRSDFSGDSGMVTAAIAFEAGASRPHAAVTFHAGAGVTHGPTEPVIGGGIRGQLGLWGPLAIVSNATGYLILDGIDSRLALALVLTAGLSR